MAGRITELPNPLFSDGRSVLSKFGYCHLEAGEQREDWAAMWELLRPDFSERTDRHVPFYTELSPGYSGSRA